jgi:predicted transcriptional regulator
MPTPRTISFRIDSEKVAELDRIAKAMDRDRSYLLNEAVENYLSEQRRFAAMVEEGREDFRKGRFYSHEEVERMAGECECEQQCVGQ